MLHVPYLLTGACGSLVILLFGNIIVNKLFHIGKHALQISGEAHQEDIPGRAIILRGGEGVAQGVHGKAGGYWLRCSVTGQLVLSRRTSCPVTEQRSILPSGIMSSGTFPYHRRTSPSQAHAIPSCRRWTYDSAGAPTRPPNPRRSCDSSHLMYCA